MEPFEEIHGAKLKEVSETSSTYVGMDEESEPLNIQGCCLAFDLGNFVIENTFTVKSSSGELVDVNELIGSVVQQAFSTKSYIRIIFESGHALEVSMKDEDFNGPEAACFEPKRSDIIVFN